MPKVLQFLVLSTLFVFSASSSAQTGAQPPLRLLFSEVKPGSMVTGQRCLLVFPDRHFHFELANNKAGRDLDRKIYEGKFSDPDWDHLSDILDRKEFRDLNVQQLAAPLVVEDLHLIAISVWRDGKFQNMEFLNNRSRAPYDATLKPLLQWWKSFSSRKMPESSQPADKHCALQGAAGDSVFAQ
jgi:hypothetical protein